MRHAPGWRSQRSLHRLERTLRGSRPAPGASAEAAVAPGGSLVPVRAAGSTPAVIGGPPWRGVSWSLVFVGFLSYMFITTTYKYGGASAAVGAAVIGLLFQRERFRFPPLVGFFTAMLAWIAVCYMQSPYPSAAWDALVDQAKIWLITLVAVNALRTRAQLRFYTIFFLACFALFPVRGAFVNFYVSGYGMFGRAVWNYIYGNPNDLAAFSLLALSMAAGLVATERKGWPRWAALSGLIVLPLLILMTQSRGAFIATSVFLMFTIASHKRRLRLIVGCVLAGVVVVMFAPSRVWDRVRGLAHATDTQQLDQVDQEGSARQRFEIWKVATTIAREHPVFGVGFGVYSLVHHEYALRSTFNPTARGYRDTHSTYINLLAEIGPVGLVLFLGLVLFTVIPAERVRRRARDALPAAAQQLLYLELGMLGYFIAGIWGSYSKITFTYVHLALIHSMARAIAAELEARGGQTTTWRRGSPDDELEPSFSTDPYVWNLRVRRVDSKRGSERKRAAGDVSRDHPPRPR